jgi:RNA polymerase sigma-70 factor, ECF subfamily
MTVSHGLSIEELVDRFGRLLYAYAFRMTSSSVDAEDIVQNVFLRAMQNHESIAQASNIQAYLFAMVRNETAKWMMRNKRVKTVDDIESVSDGQANETSDIDVDWLQVGLMKLPDAFRRILLMFYFEDASYKEIADAMEVPIGTVMSRLSRAKQALKEHLTQSESSTFRNGIQS